MRVLLFIALAGFPFLLAKEHAPFQDLAVDEQELIYELVKRLGKSDHIRQLEKRKEESECNDRVSTQKGTIIREVDSVKNGALFLTLYEHIDTNDACVGLCCKNSSCDVAVFENKENHSCYLFQCNGNCTFSHHPSYISNIFQHSPEPTVDVDGSSDSPQSDLNDHADSSVDGSPGTSVTTSVVVATHSPTASTMTSTTSIPFSVIKAYSVGLNGACKRDMHCQDPSAECNFHRCLCKSGYYQKDRVCREVCVPSSFTCLSLGSRNEGPQCVPEDQVCDSVQQCDDGSDEQDCPDPDEQLPGSQADSSSMANSDAVDAIVASQPEAETDSPSSSTPNATTTTTSPPSTTAIATNHSIFVSKEKVDMPREEISMQVPIIALSLGLACTLFLLIFVGCRLHRVKRQLRKGRHLHSNEADYLINGMYL